MTKPEALQNLRSLLIRLYDDRLSVHRVVHDAGLDVTRINLNGSLVNIWHAVLQEADKHGKLPALVQVATHEYPAHEDKLAEYLNTYIIDDEVSADSQAPPPSPEQGVGISSADSPWTGQPSEDSHVARDAAPNQIPLDVPRGFKILDVESKLLSAMFVGASKLQIVTEFTDGRTPTRVFQIRPVDADGVKELPVVAKLGPKSLIESEWIATQRHVLRRLPGVAQVYGEPSFVESEDDKLWGGLRYGQVGDGLFEAKSLAKYVADEPSLHNVWHVLHNRLLRQMGELWKNSLEFKTLYTQSSYDNILPVNLIIQPSDPSAVPYHQQLHILDGFQIAKRVQKIPALQIGDWVELTNFLVTEFDQDGYEVTLNLPQADQGTPTSYRLRLHAATAKNLNVGDILPTMTGQVAFTRQAMLLDMADSALGQTDLSKQTLPIPDRPNEALPNPLLILPSLLNRRGEAQFATVHGDLNLRNILVDPEARTTHVIDSASAGQNHALQDLLRLERDTVTDLLAKELFEARLPPSTVSLLYRYVHCAMVGEQPALGQFALPTDLHPALHKIYVMLVTIQRAARSYLMDVSTWDEYYAGLVIHHLGALKFKDLDNAPAGQRPKQVAFWAAATLCELIDGKVDCQQIKWRHLDVTSPQPVLGVSSPANTMDSKENWADHDKPSPSQDRRTHSIDTGGGAYIAGNVSIGGDFIGRDSVNRRDWDSPKPDPELLSHQNADDEPNLQGQSLSTGDSKTDDLQLSLDEQQALHAALLHAFNRGSLTQMVRFQLNENLAQITHGTNFSEDVFNLVEWAIQQGRLAELIRGACVQNPNNPKLRVFCGRY